MRFPPIRDRHVCVLSISSSFVPASSVRPLLMSSTIRNRFANEDKQGTTEVRNVALGPKVYEGERYGKMSERLKRHNIQIKGNDRVSDRSMLMHTC
ncbi:hypothetical protein B5M09_011927 [Aphanomyces astaci]|uniref:Uncharacterized protein n=1 Tax=Aphanomyces astaci TaxID=112090 RepID=A0A425DFQ0_APHAT|nr:hypothetical protein B5M09_011927 [Aphanomyces astaci]